MTHVLVVGGTGAMGSHVIQHLLATTGATITVPTRHPESAHATELAATAPHRLRLVRSDPAALDALMGQADRVFANTDFFATGSAVGEYRQGLELLTAAERPLPSLRSRAPPAATSRCRTTNCTSPYLTSATTTQRCSGSSPTVISTAETGTSPFSDASTPT
ncbi:NmrA family NAD(P)-binding protein [Streptomyces sp. A1-5]|uniref:NmrA family NAD(P)-binding protein n=1 Tax=Streptomyces sp. A1-5 TaxID=2738410 RepID=UPI001F30665E|nr:NmrA family NAD(P)-binding protein [Streptomyces sp. A1-5]